MCGIAGIWNTKSSVEDETLDRFRQAIQHRGPDGHGVWKSENGSVGLVHTRLSILDLSENGSQPMFSDDEKLVMTFNGEIFNFQSIRKELEAKKISFRTSSDSEVLLKAYQEFGLEVFNRLNGMWAVAIWDRESSELLLVRDRFGIKPLYYYQDQGIFAFGSETHVFSHLPHIKREIDHDMLQRILVKPSSLDAQGYTMFKNVFQLLPGHSLHISANHKVEQKRWYQPSIVPTNHSIEDRVEAFRSLLDDSCRLRMISDVPMATALSGGLDSSSVYATVRHLKSSGNLDKRTPENNGKAFVSIFPGTENNEEAYARDLVSHVKGEAKYHDIGTEDDLWQKIISSSLQNDVVATNPILAIESIYQQMRMEGYSISMDGHGVDEMMFGYRNMVREGFSMALRKRDQLKAIKFKNVLVSLYHPSRQKRANEQLSNEVSAAFGFKGRIKSMLGRGSADESIEANGLPQIGERIDLSGLDSYTGICGNYFFSESLPAILRSFDKAAMAHSIEIRMPFMDYRLVEFTLSLPAEMMIQNGFTKFILREAMKDRLPDSIRTRTFKVGFQSPLTQWMNTGFSEHVLQYLESSDFKSGDVTSGKLKEAFQKGQTEGWKDPSSSTFWKLFTAQLIATKS